MTGCSYLWLDNGCVSSSGLCYCCDYSKGCSYCWATMRSSAVIHFYCAVVTELQCGEAILELLWCFDNTSVTSNSTSFKSWQECLGFSTPSSQLLPSNASLCDSRLCLSLTQLILSLVELCAISITTQTESQILRITGRFQRLAFKYLFTHTQNTLLLSPGDI